MSIQLVAQTIQVILAPVVLITSIAILIGGMLQQYSATNDRLRTLARERLQLLRTTDGGIARLDDPSDAYTLERLAEIDRQIPQLMRHHRLVHKAVLTEYSAILVLVLSMIVIAFSAATRSGSAATTALVLFLLGTATMLFSILLIAMEIRVSDATVSYKVERVHTLGK